MAIEANIADRAERLPVVVSIVVQAAQAALVARTTHLEHDSVARLTNEARTTHSTARHRQAQAEVDTLAAILVAETTLAVATVAVRLDDRVA